VLCRTDDPTRKIAAEVSALCHLPAPGLPQVCSERIILRAGPNAVDLLPGAVRPLLEADLPFVLWWTDDPRDDEALFRDLADECSRLLLDLADPGADPEAVRFGLDLMINRYSRDTAWFGLLPWRELVAQLFDPPGNDEALARIDSVRIEAVSRTDKTPPRTALWLVAWLAGQLGWTPRGYPGRSSGRFKATFKGPRGLVAVEIETEAVASLDVAQITAITLTARGDEGVDTFRLSRPAPQSHEVRVEVDCVVYCSLPRVVEAHDFDPSLRVAAALERSRNDVSYLQALPHALWLLDSLKD
jgi:glucose-6-phosphate dehydrogenase assembly protein OpcA